MFRTVAAVVAATVLLSVPVCAEPVVSAKCAILMDGCTGQVLWQKNAMEQSLIASTTKIMTGLLVSEQCDLQAQVQIPKAAVGIEGSSLYLKSGEKLSVRALLYGMMLHSGNDAATALAMYCSGTEEAFAAQMNEKCKALGMLHTHFANPHGLDAENHYSTAYDLGLLTCAAMKNPVFHEVVSTKRICFGERQFVNHNKLLWQYDGAVGVKTGYTKAAGRILVSCAERQGRRLVAVTISAPDDWSDHQKLLDYGFSQFSQCQMMEDGQVVTSIPVISGAEKLALVVTEEAIQYTSGKDDIVRLCYDLPKFVYAPVVAGAVAGTAHVLVNEVEVKQYPLYWRDTVMEGA